jgi:hypothetical protein
MCSSSRHSKCIKIKVVRRYWDYQQVTAQFLHFEIIEHSSILVDVTMCFYYTTTTKYAKAPCDSSCTEEKTRTEQCQDVKEGRPCKGSETSTAGSTTKRGNCPTHTAPCKPCVMQVLGKPNVNRRVEMTTSINGIEAGKGFSEARNIMAVEVEML